jgi:hypothetical protein
MEDANASAMVAKLRAVGMELWAEGGVICSRWRDGERPPYGVAVMLADLRDLGMVAVDVLQHEALGEQSAAGAGMDDDQRVIKEGLDKPEGFDQIRAASAAALPEPDADGIVRLIRVPPEVAFAAGDLINDGKAELIGQVIYMRISNVFDVTYRVVEP